MMDGGSWSGGVAAAPVAGVSASTSRWPAAIYDIVNTHTRTHAHTHTFIYFFEPHISGEDPPTAQPMRRVSCVGIACVPAEGRRHACPTDTQRIS